MRNVVHTIYRLTSAHHIWRASCLNMIASESLTSPLVEALLASDFSRRYSGQGAYAGDRYYLEIVEIVKDLARQLFKAKYIELRPATGHLAVLGVICGLLKPGDTMTQVDPRWGGYPLGIAEWANLGLAFYPFEPDSLGIDAAGASELVLERRPNLVVAGASEFLFPHPLATLAAAAHAVGAPVFYDGSHVMGLILGGRFQDPFAEGADVLGGSTHKTIFGPQRGVIATNREDLYRRITRVFDDPPFLVSCHHLNSMVALGVALAEVVEFGVAFAAQVEQNAQSLACGLHERGIPVRGSHLGFTRSHQVILDNGEFGSPEALAIKARLEDVGIIADLVVRFGVQELTRLGMKEGEMVHVAGLIADTIQQTRAETDIRLEVQELSGAFQQIHYSFCEEEQAYAFLGGAMGEAVRALM